METQAAPTKKQKYDAVLFDLLSALIDSWSLWDAVAGDDELGRQWRMQYLDLTYRAGHYSPYMNLVKISATAAGISASLAQSLADRWGDLAPWPEAPSLIAELLPITKIGVVTNCSDALARETIHQLGLDFKCVLTAERAGYYKPNPKIYQQAIEEIGVAPDRILYVAGSPFDVRGAASAGMDVYWHNRIGLDDPVAYSTAIQTMPTLEGVKELLISRVLM